MSINLFTQLPVLDDPVPVEYNEFVYSPANCSDKSNDTSIDIAKLNRVRRLTVVHKSQIDLFEPRCIDSQLKQKTW